MQCFPKESSPLRSHTQDMAHTDNNASMLFLIENDVPVDYPTLQSTSISFKKTKKEIWKEMRRIDIFNLSD